MSDRRSPHAYVLDAESAGAYARTLGLEVNPASARLLSGGVSSAVVALDGEPPVVLKQALPRLRVASVWEADPNRSTTEADALRVLHAITPDHVPAVLASDPVAHVLAIRRAPEHWLDWRAVLLDAPSELDVARGHTAGTVLGQWHAATWDSADVRESFDHGDAFEDLRLDPFHRELLRRGAVPQEYLQPLIDELAAARQCLVHGDFSPKNILVGDLDTQLWIIDAEVAHVGAAVFDLAFLVAHLALKAVHASRHSAILRRTSEAFQAAYESANPNRVDPPSIDRHAAAIMLARVAGKSPASYLDPASADRVAVVARLVLQREAESLWDSVESVAEVGA